MILVDTSVWIDHFRKTNEPFSELLNNGQVVCHSFVVGELACGNMKNRHDIMSLLQELPTLDCVSDDEILFFIEKHALMGKGLGLVDIHLLASALLHDTPLWTLDKRLKKEAIEFQIDY
jgi:hypothetical protein